MELRLGQVFKKCLIYICKIQTKNSECVIKMRYNIIYKHWDPINNTKEHT